MFLNCCHLVAKPNRDLVDAFSGRNQQTGESMSHGVRCDPLAFLFAHVVCERGAKIIPVQTLSMWHVRSEHERGAHTVGLKEVLKLQGQRNRALLTVFEIHGRGLPQMKAAIFNIKPKRARFDYFLKAQTCVKTAEKNKPQFVARGFAYQIVSNLVGTKVFASASYCSGNLYIFCRVPASDARDFDSPAEKRTQRHDISERGCVRRALEGRVVKLLDLPRRYNSSGRVRWQPCGEQKKLVAFRDGARTRVLLLANFVSDKAINLGIQWRARFEREIFPYYFDSAYRFDGIGSLKRDPGTLPVALNSQPVNLTTKVDSSPKSSSVTAGHELLLSHMDCHTFNKNLACIAFDRRTIGENNTSQTLQKTLLRRWFRVQVPANPVSLRLW
jgi:hypothetical protein